jgi:hypothetical protein
MFFYLPHVELMLMINTSTATFYRAIRSLDRIRLMKFPCQGIMCFIRLLLRWEYPMANQILAIAPYWLESAGTWVFDDEAVELVQEPFVSGVPEMIDELVAEIPNAKSGFRLLFSASPFPGFQRKMTRVREEAGGWWYSTAEPEAEGWLCPALFRYFDEAPEEIYVKAEAKTSD